VRGKAGAFPLPGRHSLWDSLWIIPVCPVGIVVDNPCAGHAEGRLLEAPRHCPKGEKRPADVIGAASPEMAQSSASFFKVALKLRLFVPTSVVPNTSA
jgi:hypothetical protein